MSRGSDGTAVEGVLYYYRDRVRSSVSAEPDY